MALSIFPTERTVTTLSDRHDHATVARGTVTALKVTLARVLLRRRLRRLEAQIDPEHYDPTLSRRIDRILIALEEGA